ncbi:MULTISPECIES: hypothetical protein [unclassified Sphingobacterium]|uniref:hypothetical protein n=1 Tax=unclassified Sphingobacterium TaxID=2609468 RepID=UPI001049F383|nr:MULTISPECIES: hypothetical protein [unclassified Sphingobacterium]MCS3554726.1 hypothetical protein [Sphingobacterium sp. JUb21]
MKETLELSAAQVEDRLMERYSDLTDHGLKDEIVLQNVMLIRKELPRLGTHKLHIKLKRSVKIA